MGSNRGRCRPGLFPGRPCRRVLARPCPHQTSGARPDVSFGSVIGYARVITSDQSLEIQEAALKTAGCDVIRAEKRSGTTTSGRAELQTVLDFLSAGDVLMVTRIDRLARSIGDLQDIVRAVKAKGASLKATEQPIDTSTAAGKAFLDMLGVFAEFETNLRKERQLEGIAKAKAAGVYKGRKPSVDVSQVRALKQDGVGPSAIAKTLGIGRASVYRALNEPIGRGGRSQLFP
jgi:DNA invertase Pin-like site-specific DNA recombinase